jgi:predicted O-methyltransferase YrrM
VLLADNVLADGEVADAKAASPTAQAIRRFLAAVRTTASLRSVIVPLGDGCLFGVKQ